MYVPHAFAETSLGALYDLIDRHSFGLLVVHGDDGIEGAHIPFVLDRGHGAHGRLRGHVAKANPIWGMAEEAGQALAVFQGPHAYISPDWYAHDGLVPTWNYTAAHVYGRPHLLTEAETATLLNDLTAINEAGLAPKSPWTTEKIKPAVRTAMQAQIVGIALDITRIDGKAKLGQNRTPADVDGAVRALRARGGEADRAVADLMQSKLSNRSSA